MEVSGKLHTPALYPQEGAPDINQMGGWVGPKDILGIWRINSLPLPRTEQLLRHLVIFNHASLATAIVAF